MSARRVGQVLLVPVWGVVLVLLALVVARLVAFDDRHFLMLVNAFTLWIYLPAYAILVAALCARSRLLAVAAGVIVVAHLAWVLPPMFRTVPVSAAAARAPRLRVASANVRFNNPNHVDVLAELERFDADVVVMEEVTPAWWASIERSRLASSHPHVAKAIVDSPAGMAILSRRPLADVEVKYADEWPVLLVTVEVRGRPVRIAGVHPVAPLETFAANQRAQRAITGMVRGLPRPRLVVGDFNASPTNRWHGQLLDLGLRDSHEAVGRPFATTWPNGDQLVPPLRLDYVFADPAITPLRAREGRGQGSDHRPIVVDLAVEQ